MSISHSIDRQWSGSNGSPINPPAQVASGSEELNFDLALAGGSTNTQFGLAFTQANLQSIYIYTDEEDVTIKTNSTGSPQDTLTITAGVPLVWTVGCGLANPFTGNVTTAYATNTNGNTATNLKVRCLTNG